MWKLQNKLSTRVGQNSWPRFGEFCSCCCLPFLPQLAWRIHAFWGPLLALSCTTCLPSPKATYALFTFFFRRRARPLGMGCTRVWTGLAISSRTQLANPLICFFGKLWEKEYWRFSRQRWHHSVNPFMICFCWHSPTIYFCFLLPNFCDISPDW